MKIRAIINEPYAGIVSGWSLRYVNILRELSAAHDLTVYVTAVGHRLSRDLPNARVISAESTTPQARPSGRLAFFRSMLSPSRDNVVFPAFERYVELDRVLGEDSMEYDGEIYFHLASLINYGGHRRAPIVVCDFCDSRLRALAAMGAGVGGLQRFFTEVYVRRLKRRLVPPDIVVAAITPEDCRHIGRVLRNQRLLCLPNGVESCGPLPGQGEIRDKHSAMNVVFVGSLNFPPNHDAVERLLGRIWPAVMREIPSATLTIVGRSPPPSIARMAGEEEGVTLLGDVASVQPYIRAATLTVCPIFIGAGMKNKVLESVACGTPVVASEEAVIGIAFEDGVQGYAGASEAVITKSLIEGLQLPFERYSRMVEAAGALGRRSTWAHAIEPLLDVLSGHGAIRDRTGM